MVPKSHERLRAADKKAYASFVEASNSVIVGRELLDDTVFDLNLTYTNPADQSRTGAKPSINTPQSATSSPT
jgi:hypothetical protein